MTALKKLENLWYYHKVKLIGAVIIIAAVFIVLAVTGDEIKPDVELAYVTDGRTISDEAVEYLNGYFADKMTDVNKDSNKRMAFVPLQGPRIDMEFVAEGSQIVLMDGNTLRKFIGTGVLAPVDDYAKKINLDFKKYPDINTSTEVSGIPHIYAIPMEYIPVLLDIGFPAEDYYLTIRAANSKSKTAMEKRKNAELIVDTLFN